MKISIVITYKPGLTRSIALNRSDNLKQLMLSLDTITACIMYLQTWGGKTIISEKIFQVNVDFIPILSLCGRDWLLITSTAHLAARTSWTVSMLSRPHPLPSLSWRSTKTPESEHLIRLGNTEFKYENRQVRFIFIFQVSINQCNESGKKLWGNVSDPQNRTDWLFYQN